MTPRILVLLAIPLLLASPCRAQWPPRGGEPFLSLEPYGEVFGDAFVPSGERRAGLAFGARIGYGIGRFRIFQEFGFGRTAGVPGAPGAGPVRHEWLFTSSGVDYLLVRSPLDVLARAGLGVAYRRVEPEDAPDNFITDFRSHDQVLAGLVLRRSLTPRVAVTLSVVDHVYGVFGGSLQHGPGASLGILLW